MIDSVFIVPKWYTKRLKIGGREKIEIPTGFSYEDDVLTFRGPEDLKLRLRFRPETLPMIEIRGSIELETRKECFESACDQVWKHVAVFLEDATDA